MEQKKVPGKDVHQHVQLWTSIGFLVSLSLVLTAFEWRTHSEPIVDLRYVIRNADDVLIDVPITQITPPKPAARLIKLIETKEPDEIEINVPPIDIDPDESIEVPLPTPEPESEAESDLPHIVVEESASPKGGIAAFYKYLNDKVKYPTLARRIGIEGIVVVEFVIAKDGTLTDVKVIKGIGAGCDEEAVRIIKAAPPWNPGKQRGKPVRQRYTLPIYFKLS